MMTIFEIPLDIPDVEIKNVELTKKAPFGCKSIVALAEHWMVPIR